MSDVKDFFMEELKSGVHGQFLEFGTGFDPMYWARLVKGANINRSVESIDKECAKWLHAFNFLLTQRVPNRNERNYIVQAAREVIVHVALRVMCEYEGAARSVRVEASHRALSKKGALSEAATWSVIDNFILNNEGKRPKAKQLKLLVTSRRKEIGLYPEVISEHQIARHFHAWREAHPKSPSDKGTAG